MQSLHPSFYAMSVGFRRTSAISDQTLPDNPHISVVKGLKIVFKEKLADRLLLESPVRNVMLRMVLYKLIACT